LERAARDERSEKLANRPTVRQRDDDREEKETEEVSGMQDGMVISQD